MSHSYVKVIPCSPPALQPAEGTCALKGKEPVFPSPVHLLPECRGGKPAWSGRKGRYCTWTVWERKMAVWVSVKGLHPNQ